jgi:hypothetical protein
VEEVTFSSEAQLEAEEAEVMAGAKALEEEEGGESRTRFHHVVHYTITTNMHLLRLNPSFLILYQFQLFFVRDVPQRTKKRTRIPHITS